jgi:asparagine synthase (glutamine-hydrolysing)
MCGIFGIVAPDIDQQFLEKATGTLVHRGPDAAGYFRDGAVALGHRRLSIIDLAGGQQPIFNEDGSKCVICNGEIYNYLELRTRLADRGHRFATGSDTEVILHAYEEWGEECVAELRGMFAFAVWDREEQLLFLGRDRLGIKPLFYADHGGDLRFASEMKAILADDRFPRRIDELSLVSYFSLGYISGEQTIYRDIHKLLPGHTLTWRKGSKKVSRYWDIHLIPDRGKSERYFVDGFMERLQEAVASHLMSEVPLGAFLSGGIDSSTVVALMSQLCREPVNTFCMGFGGDVGGYLDERRFARQVAERYRTAHREHEVLPSPEGLLETIVRAFDEPFADDSVIPSYFVCKIAREGVTVALSGLGGDEIFAGYERHLGFALSSGYRRLPNFFRERLIRPAVDRIPERADGHYTINHLKRFVRGSSLEPGHRYYGYLSRMPAVYQQSFFADAERFAARFQECRGQILDWFHAPNAAGGSDSLNRALYCDLKGYLPEDILAVTDRMSMQHALEVRVPFLDHKFIEFCATIPPEMKIKRLQKKYLLKRGVNGHLPREVISHRKQGFVGPMARWLRSDLKGFVLDSLSERNLAKHGLLNPATVQTILNEHFSGKEIHDTLIWSMVVFQSWFDLYLDGNASLAKE